MDSIYLSEAFKQLKILDEEDFQLSADVDATDKIKDFVDQDEVSDDIEVIDTEAQTEEELQDSYIGKVILDCPVCHSKIYKSPEEIVVSEEDESLVNIDEECPYCYTVGGFKVIGEVAPYGEAEETTELDYSPEEDEEDIEVDDIQEALKKGQTVKYKGEPVKVLKVSKDDPDYGEIKYRGKKVFTNDFDESLEENDSFDFTSDVYDALSNVMSKYRNKGFDRADMDSALEWFDIHFWEMDFNESLKASARRNCLTTASLLRASPLCAGVCLLRW